MPEDAAPPRPLRQAIADGPAGGAGAVTDLPRSDKREANKAKRRERIMNAARELIAEGGNASFSMQVLADRSSVSLATIYNLIGQKHDLLLEIFSTDFDRFTAELAESKAKDPLERMFDALDLATRHLYRGYAFSRALFSALFSTSGYELARLFQRPRANYWAGMVGEAMAAGLLAADTQPTLVSAVLDDVYRSVMIRWLWQDMDAKRFRALLGHRFAVVLLAFATPVGAVRLKAEVTACEALLDRQRTAQEA